jgi:hypothetical protein
MKMSDNTDEHREDAPAPEGAEPEAPLAEAAPIDPRTLIVHFGFAAPDSIAFKYERGNNTSAWQLFAIAEHLRIEAEMEMMAWLASKHAETLRAAQPPMEKRTKEMPGGKLPRGSWKPPALRK